jgi:DNA-binding transcriptional regulator YdaS (Cro superfamily)
MGYYMSILGDFLKQEKISQAEFGKKIGVNQAAVNQWVLGLRPIAPEKALDIEEAYGLDAELLSPKLAELVARINKRAKKLARNQRKIMD